MNLDQKILKNHYLAHHRYTNDEYLLDQKTYQYIMNFVSNFRYSMHMIPDDEWINCERLINEKDTEHCSVRINELVFESNGSD